MNHQKFLEFNGKNIVFLNVDGTYWIALRPICEALNIEYTRSFKNAKNDPILGPALAVQPMQVSKNGRKQLRNVTCIPERFVYGWIFSLRSDSPELTAYKRTCYELLYDHFHGTITNRKELLMERKLVDSEIFHLKQAMKEENEKFQKIQELEKKRKALNRELSSIDDDLLKQRGLFDKD